jgi:hypothetical protein
MATLLGLESPWTGGKRSVRNGNIIAKIRHCQIVDRGFSRGTQVRHNSVLTMKRSEKGEQDSIKPGTSTGTHRMPGGSSCLPVLLVRWLTFAGCVQ